MIGVGPGGGGNRERNASRSGWAEETSSESLSKLKGHEISRESRVKLATGTVYWKGSSTLKETRKAKKKS